MLKLMMVVCGNWNSEIWSFKKVKFHPAGQLMTTQSRLGRWVDIRSWGDTGGRCQRHLLPQRALTRYIASLLPCLRHHLKSISWKLTWSFRIHWTRLGHSNRGYNHQRSFWQLGKLWCKSLKRASHNLEEACVTGTGNLLKVMRQNLTCLWVLHQVNIFV